jgi:choline dehydrogenase
LNNAMQNVDAQVKEFDYIVVGAGSAGCVLAARLTEDPSVRVLLLEAGPPDTSIWIHLPIGYGKTMWDKSVNWCFETEPDPNMLGRKIYWPRGKTLGGSSSINGLIYIRGQREDYDDWARAGNPGWSFDECLPYFKRSERNQRGASGFHGGDGPIGVSDIGAQHELIEAFIAGAAENGVPRTEDFNGEKQVGAGYYQLTTWKGLRCSTAKGYLTPAVKARPNLKIETHALATRVRFEGTRAVGVDYTQKGAKFTASARSEVLLSAGAIQSPQLLQLSGVGDAALLQKLGIPVVHHASQVGKNLQDHLQIRLSYECTKPITTNDQLNSVFGKIGMGMEWFFKRSGPLAVGINQGGCFMATSAAPDKNRPDIQFHVATLSADMAGGKVHPYSGFTLSVCQLRPESRGHLEITTTDPTVPPAMHANYLATDLDRRTAVAAVRAARAIAQSKAMSPYVKKEFKPGPDLQTDEEILHFCRQVGATIFHPSGTCRMGIDSEAVVDPRLRVNGVQGLRVIDGAIIPTLVSGNTNAPIIMVAEKAVEMIREDAKR